MRIQFTPDLLPSDLIGTEIYLHEKSEFDFRKGPLFNSIILADEINRAPAKVQSALLEAMEEKQVSVGHYTYKLPKLYMVLATQNPVEQEGTYNLPEAQLDRFLMHVNVDYPDHDQELEILKLDEVIGSKEDKDEQPIPVIKQEEIFFCTQRNCRSFILMISCVIMWFHWLVLHAKLKNIVKNLQVGYNLERLPVQHLVLSKQPRRLLGWRVPPMFPHITFSRLH